MFENHTVVSLFSLQESVKDTLEAYEERLDILVSTGGAANKKEIAACVAAISMARAELSLIQAELNSK